MFAIVITTLFISLILAIIGYEIYDWKNDVSPFQKKK